MPIEPEPSSPDKPMPQADRIFYVLSGAFLVVLGTGLWMGFVNGTWWPSGLPLTVASIMGLIATVIERPRLNISAAGYVILTAAISAALLSIYDIQNRDRPLLSNTVATPTMVSPNAWQPTAAASSNREETPPASRVFLNANITPEYLISIVRQHTDIQSRKLIKPYLGKWMRIAGSVFDVSDLTPGPVIYLNTNPKALFLVIARVNKKEADSALSLTEKDQVEITGRLTDVDYQNVKLDWAEFDFSSVGK